MSYFLTISLTDIILAGDVDYASLAFLFLKSFIIGGVIGYVMGKLSTWVINKISLNTDGLYPVLVLGLAMFTYGITHRVGGNGFLAIYICALVLGNSNFVHKKSLIRFYAGQAWLMQIVMFLTLGLLVFPSKVIPVVGMGLLISAFLIVVARPVGVFLSLVFFKTNLNARVFISWVGLRGAVPIVFATYPLIAGLDKSELIFNLVFFISVSSVLLQGTTISLVAKWLGLLEPADEHDAMIKDGRVKIKELLIPAHSRLANLRIVELQFPNDAQIMTIRRGEEYIQPDGTTKLEAGDRIFILADNSKAMKEALKIFEGEASQV
jgi:cell volume regulation protein A